MTMVAKAALVVLLSLTACSHLVSEARAADDADSQARLVVNGPPICERRYTADGVEAYDDIAARFYPMGVPASDPKYFALYTYIQVANLWNDVTMSCSPKYGCCGDCPAVPHAGQVLLIPPCTWAEGCRAVVPLNVTQDQQSAKHAVAELVFGKDATTEQVQSVWLPYTYSLGGAVGPPEVAYVPPCASSCCSGSVVSG